MRPQQFSRRWTPIRKRYFPLLLWALCLLIFPLSVSADPVFTIAKQPESVSVPMGMETDVTIDVLGEGLQYQWYFKNADRDQFYKTACTESTYSVTMNEERNGRQIFCAVSDAQGNYLQSHTVTLSATSGFAEALYKLRPDESLSLALKLNFETDEPIRWRSSDTQIATVDKAGNVTGISDGIATITGVGESSGFYVCCQVKVCDLKRVALTFDDGPSKHTSRLLDYLGEHEEVKVTFFMVGSRLSYYEETIQRIAQQGHELAYHSYSHRNQTRLSDATILSDFETSAEILSSITDQSFTLWRTPGGNFNSRVLECIPLPHIMWSVDTRDWANRNSYTVHYRIKNNSKDGSIVLLHDLHGTTVDGAIRAIDDMLSDGDYEFLTVTELLSLDGTPPEAYMNYYQG